MQMTPIQKIDAVLKYFNSVETDEPKTVNQIRSGLLTYGKIDHSVSIREVYEIMMKLNKDGYVDLRGANYFEMPIGDVKCYTSFDGRLFMSKGGYKSQVKKENNNKILKLLERLMLAIGAVFGTLYGAAQFFQDSELRNILIAISLAAVITTISFIILSSYNK